MNNVFKILTIIFLLIFLFPTNSFCSEWSGSTNLQYDNLAWTFEFKVLVNVDKEGIVTASISDLKLSNPSAWVSINLQPEITKISRGYSRISADITVHFNGIANDCSCPLGKTIWGPETSHAEKTWKDYDVFVDIPDDQMPPHFHIGESPPFEWPNNQNNNQNNNQDNENNPCNIFSRTTSRNLTREAYSNKTYIKFKRGIVQIKPVGCNHWVKTETNMELKVGDIIKSGPNGMATIVLSGESFVRLKRNSKLIIPKVESNVEIVSFLKLAHGVLCSH